MAKQVGLAPTDGVSLSYVFSGVVEILGDLGGMPRLKANGSTQAMQAMMLAALLWSVTWLPDTQQFQGLPCQSI